jgi:hypothetical protein
VLPSLPEQRTLAGMGGAHHCLCPEMRRVIVKRVGSELVLHEETP